MDVEADLMEIRQPLPSSPFSFDEIERLLTTSQILQHCGVNFAPVGEGVWELSFKNQLYRVTFDVQQFDEIPSLRLMSFGDPLFEKMLTMAVQRGNRL